MRTMLNASIASEPQERKKKRLPESSLVKGGYVMVVVVPMPVYTSMRLLACSFWCRDQ